MEDTLNIRNIFVTAGVCLILFITGILICDYVYAQDNSTVPTNNNSSLNSTGVSCDPMLTSYLKEANYGLQDDLKQKDVEIKKWETMCKFLIGFVIFALAWTGYVIYSKKN
jgi:hypothetical protein